MNSKSNAKIFITIEDITDYITYDEFIDELEKESSNIRSIINRCEKLKEKAWEDELNRYRLETAERIISCGKAWKIAGAVICIAGLLISIGTAVVTVYDYYKYYHQEYTPIPDKIVHESTDSKRRTDMFPDSPLEAQGNGSVINGDRFRSPQEEQTSDE